MKKALPFIILLIALLVGIAAMKHKKQATIKCIQTVEQSKNVTKGIADEIDKQGGNSKQLREKIEYYDQQLKHYKEVLYYMRWL